MKNFLVTGASRGLGLIITQRLVQEGHRVYCVNRSVPEELTELKTKFPHQMKILSFDLTNVDAIRDNIFKTFLNKEPLHGFVNNAAYAYDDIATNASATEIEKMFRVNVFSPMILCKYAIRNMLLHKVAGSIVHISSISVHTGYKGLSMYAASKGALEAYSKNVAREWGSLGIRSNTIVAGFMETAMSATLDEGQKNRIYRRTSLKKATSPNSVAAMVAYLLSEDACSVTGQHLHVDSGTI